jgi:hypothetical protein
VGLAHHGPLPCAAHDEKEGKSPVWIWRFLYDAQSFADNNPDTRTDRGADIEKVS